MGVGGGGGVGVGGNFALQYEEFRQRSG